MLPAWVASSGSPFVASHPRTSTCATTGALEALRQLDGVAHVVVVAVRDEDQVDALGLCSGSGHFGFPWRNGST